MRVRCVLLCLICFNAHAMDEAQLKDFVSRIQEKNHMTLQNYPTQNLSHNTLLQAQQTPKRFILVSFSMPEPLILDYIRQAQTQDAWVVFRGFKGNDLNTMLSTLREWDTKIDINRILIDPTLFTRYDVSQVPTFIFTQDAYPCDRNVCNANHFNKISGSISLDYAINAMKDTDIP